MRRELALLALALLALAGGCTRRDRANPLDPANPDSRGAPQGFNAVAGFSTVRLSWTPRPDLAIDGFRLSRLAPGDSLYRPLGPVQPPNAGAYLDAGVFNDRDYRYRLQYVVDGVAGGGTAEDLATPGTVRAWAVDARGGRLLQLSPDARDLVVARSGLGETVALAVTPEAGTVWVSDDLGGRVHLVDPQSLGYVSRNGLGQPFTLALDPFDDGLWVCDLAGLVRHLTSAGQPGVPSSLNLLLEPSGVAVSPLDGSVWVVERSGRRVRRYAHDGTPLGSRSLDLPSRVVVDSLTGTAWVSSLSTGWVWQVSPSLTVLDSLPLEGPIGLAVDPRRRMLWVADAIAEQLVGIDLVSGQVRSRAAIGGEPRDVTVDLDRGEPWVAARLAGAVVRCSPGGVPLTAVTGLGEVLEVRLDLGHR